MTIVITIAAVLISLAIGIPIGIAYRKKVAESKIQGAENEAKRLVDLAKKEAENLKKEEIFKAKEEIMASRKELDQEIKERRGAENEAKRLVDLAKKEAENLKKEEIFKAKEEIMASRKELDQEIKERRGDVQRQEARLIQKEENLERRSDNFEKKEKELERELQEVEKQKEAIAQLHEDEMMELQRIAALTKEEAKERLLSEMEKELVAEKAALIREQEQKAKETVGKDAKEMLCYAIQKCAADHSQETTVSIVALPSDEMKGRIIGREGRNIKALETLTGIDLIIDDTPEAVVLSGFDPLRREVAKIALEKLIDDGRIHPAKIEEMVEKAKEEVENTIKEEGERAVLETGVIGLHPDIVKLLGKLKYRTSYGQNVLNHSIEVSNLARIMADELGLDPKLARRAGLLHDIGKALDHDMEGTHVEIGVDVLKKYKENSLVVNAVEAHHGDVEPQTLEAVLVQAADAISASRPGARREMLNHKH